MFDTHKIDVRFPEKIIHEEKRAPTDLSLSLVKEYQEKIEESIIEKILVKDNCFDYTVVIINDSLCRRFLYIKLKINGQEFSEKFEINFEIQKAENQVYAWMCSKFLKPIFNEIYCSNLSGSLSHYGTFTITNIKEENKSNEA